MRIQRVAGCETHASATYRPGGAFIPPGVIILGLAWVMFGGQMPLVALQVIGLQTLAIGVLNSIFNRMHSQEVPMGAQLRRSLESARRYFLHELAKENPRLRDEWFPYLLAFGLGPKVDRWFRSFGGSLRTSSSGFGGSSSSSSISPSTNVSSWSGGGGSFSGAGASGSWASVVSIVSAGVAKPSSGGSGGGGGGGGGGGW